MTYNINHMTDDCFTSMLYDIARGRVPTFYRGLKLDERRFFILNAMVYGVDLWRVSPDGVSLASWVSQDMPLLLDENSVARK